MKRYEEAEARKLTEEQFNDILYQAEMEEAKGSKAVVEFNAKDPSGLDHTGVYLEVVILQDNIFAVRDRWLTYDADYEITGYPHAVFRALVDQVDAQEVEDDQEPKLGVVYIDSEGEIRKA